MVREFAAITHRRYSAAPSAPLLAAVYEDLRTRVALERTRAVDITSVLVGLGADAPVISAPFSPT